MPFGMAQIVQADGTRHVAQAVQELAENSLMFIRVSNRIAGKMAKQGGTASDDVEDGTHAAHPGAVKAAAYTRSVAIL
jgi:hypothetical protein